MPNVLTIPEAVQRAKAEGIPVSAYSLRAWIRSGVIPVRKAGQKTLIYYPNLVRFIQCEDGADNAPATPKSSPGIRRIGVV